jgi:DNA-directed RNA polymerase specialized sigma24 family protein
MPSRPVPERFLESASDFRIMHLPGAPPPEQLQSLRLRYVKGLPRAEIAYVLGIPEKVVKSRLFEGLQRLRKHTSLLEDC